MSGVGRQPIVRRRLRDEFVEVDAPVPGEGVVLAAELLVDERPGGERLSTVAGVDPDLVVPIHDDTSPAIETDARAVAADVVSRGVPVAIGTEHVVAD